MTSERLSYLRTSDSQIEKLAFKLETAWLGFKLSIVSTCCLAGALVASEYLLYVLEMSHWEGVARESAA